MNGNGPIRSARERAMTGVANDGFDGRLRCASLADLVQLECLSGARAAVSVVSGGRQGHLFFDGGELIHATTGRMHGEEAALEILGWTTGTFGDSRQPWPLRATIGKHWQQLLLLTAQRLDERVRDAAHEEPVAGQSSSRLVAVSTIRPPPKPTVLPLTSGAVRFDADGAIVAQRGNSHGLSVLGLELWSLVSEIGDELGLNGFSELRWEREASQLAMYTDDGSRSMVLVEAAPLVSLEAIKGDARV